MTQCLAHTTPMDNHCCWLSGVQCLHVKQREDGTWECLLRSELGSWEAVHADPRYVHLVKPLIQQSIDADIDCGDWPVYPEKCGTCGAGGDSG